ncbi:hypothetical protein BOX15_Mlig009910g2 [Macrostomum lignano]|uniref:Translocon-associated protein subunit gamma n=3 Tax=Macrostomum lignano TaxID=282301 RepID=A0A1I8HH84_9PLAT|nr:hypothetical protein BOX15_Mlig009910g3 [Macrostomum lignano]PAA57591.1 hypothetical protein BOX15_Mlig009910g2 [Macrostomum lignano]
MSKKLTSKQEDILLQDYSRSLSTKSNALFYGNGLIVSAVPIMLFWRIHMMDPYQNAPLFAAVVLGCSYLIAFAYKNVKFVVKHRISQVREDAISQELTQEAPKGKKVSKKERDDMLLWRKNEVADYEATTFSIFFNNVIFLLLVVFLSFFLLRSSSNLVNYLLSMLLSSGFVALLSTGSGAGKR